MRRRRHRRHESEPAHATNESDDAAEEDHADQPWQRAPIAAFGEKAKYYLDQAEGRVDVEAVTAVPLSEELRSQLVERIQSQTGREVSLSERVDSEIVGGLMLQVGGVQVDGSVRYRLADLRRELTAAPVDRALAS